MTPEREKEIRENILKETWGTNSFGLDVIKELLAEIDRLRDEQIRLGRDLMEMIELKRELKRSCSKKLAVANDFISKIDHAGTCGLICVFGCKYEEATKVLSKIRGGK